MGDGKVRRFSVIEGQPQYLQELMLRYVEDEE